MSDYVAIWEIVDEIRAERDDCAVIANKAANVLEGYNLNVVHTKLINELRGKQK